MPAEPKSPIQEAADRAAIREALRYATTHKQPLTLNPEQVALLDRHFTEVESSCGCGRCHLSDA